MADIPFCHLHFHTCYSLLDGTAKIRESVKTAAELGMKHLAMTDHGVLYGAVEFYKAAHSAGIKPIIGCEVYLARHGIEERSSQRNNMHLVLLAETQEGYENLVRLVSIAHLEGLYYKPRIDKKLLRKYARGLIGLSACLRGEVTEACTEGDLERAERLALEYADILGEGNFFLEIQDHGIDEQKTANRNLFELARRTGLPLVATNDVHYVRKEHAEAHDVLICLQRNDLVADPNRHRYPGDQFYMKSGAEMAALFPDHPEAIANTVEIARRCNVEFFFPERAEDLHFPVFPLPEDFDDASRYLVHLGHTGLRRLYDMPDPANPKTDREREIMERFDYEVGIIEKTNYVNYFLVVADFIQWARRQGIPVGPGRGSGAGSLLAYSLEITTVDPLKYNLIFERFLNPERVSPPDFDIDFCPTRRQQVIQYVREKYGEECVAQIITFGSLGAKTLMRDLGRVLEIPLLVCDRLAKLIPDAPGTTLEKALAESPDFKKAAETEPEARRIMKYARVLEGLPRHTGMHAAGVVIGEKPLIEIIPLTREPKEKLIVVQFEKGPTEEIGLLKMDFLGLKNLTIIRETCDLIERNHGLRIDPEKLELEDPPTFDLLARGDTVGIFQLESGGMRDVLRQMKPDCIEDVIAILALYRPGPMQFIPDFIKRKHGQDEVRYDHPLLEPILKETYGIIVYQEQIQQAAQTLAGFSLGQGDILRRAMGKKKPEVMAAQRQKFVDGCRTANGIDAKQAGEIFDNIEKFAQYGFNKSHSTAYGFVTFQTAWLKAHYPAEFMAALLSGEMGDTDKLSVFIGETNEMGIEVLAPCVNESLARFNAVDEKRIRFGLAAIKGVGEGVVEQIVGERDANGPFEGLMDFCARVPGANKKVLESLVRAGAFDFAGLHRARLFGGIEIALARAASSLKDKLSGQRSMFDLLGEDGGKDSDEELPDRPPWSESELLAAEKELIGFFLSGHPLARFEWELDRFALHRLRDVAALSPGEKTRIGGMIVDLRKLYTKKDQRPMAAFRIEGLEGHVDAILFPDFYEKYGPLVEPDALVMLGGLIKNDNGRDLDAPPTFQVMEIHPIEKAGDLFCERLSIHLPEMGVNGELLEKLRAVIEEFPGATRLQICIEFVEGQKVFVSAERGLRIRACSELVKRIERLVGEGLVYVAKRSSPLLSPPRERKWKKARA